MHGGPCPCPQAHGEGTTMNTEIKNKTLGIVSATEEQRVEVVGSGVGDNVRTMFSQ